jgi:chromate transport protein ChrA
VAAIAIFLPSFVMMFARLPVFERVRTIGWAKAARPGMVAGVIGVLAVTLTRLAPHAVVQVVPSSASCGGVSSPRLESEFTLEGRTTHEMDYS